MMTQFINYKTIQRFIFKLLALKRVRSFFFWGVYIVLYSSKYLLLKQYWSLLCSWNIPPILLYMVCNLCYTCIGQLSLPGLFQYSTVYAPSMVSNIIPSMWTKCTWWEFCCKLFNSVRIIHNPINLLCTTKGTGVICTHSKFQQTCVNVMNTHWCHCKEIIFQSKG